MEVIAREKIKTAMKPKIKLDYKKSKFVTGNNKNIARQVDNRSLAKIKPENYQHQTEVKNKYNQGFHLKAVNGKCDLPKGKKREKYRSRREPRELLPSDKRVYERKFVFDSKPGGRSRKSAYNYRNYTRLGSDLCRRKSLDRIYNETDSDDENVYQA